VSYVEVVTCRELETTYVMKEVKHAESNACVGVEVKHVFQVQSSEVKHAETHTRVSERSPILALVVQCGCVIEEQK